MQGIIDKITAELTCIGSITDKSVQGIITGANAKNAGITDNSIQGIIDKLSNFACVVPLAPALPIGNPSGLFQQIVWQHPCYGTFIGLARSSVSSEPQVGYFQIIVPTTTVSSSDSNMCKTRIGIIRKKSSGAVSAEVLSSTSTDHPTNSVGPNDSPTRTSSYFARVIPIEKGETVYLCCIIEYGTSAHYTYRSVDPTAGFTNNMPFGLTDGSSYSSVPTSVLVYGVGDTDKGIFADVNGSPSLYGTGTKSTDNMYAPIPEIPNPGTGGTSSATYNFSHDFDVGGVAGFNISGIGVILIELEINMKDASRFAWRAGTSGWFADADMYFTTKQAVDTVGGVVNLAIAGSLGTENVKTDTLVTGVNDLDYLTGSTIAQGRLNVTNSPINYTHNGWVISSYDTYPANRQKIAIPVNFGSGFNLRYVRLAGPLKTNRYGINNQGISGAVMAVRAFAYS
ncbi:MAG: hypothetical protein BWY14_01211 [Parcubacteria group bacterium ADurb.Bin192]|nr:MAG: hypothetical protein BWY14_01211 [Parcubacteria group bacterium ADurb.Bin192]